MQIDRKKMVGACAGLVTVLLGMQSAYSQCTFLSGSTGADGDFIPTTSMPGTGWSISNNVVTVTNSANGVFNFGRIYVETNWVVKFTKNTLNTPVYLLATNDVTIKGTINLDGSSVYNNSGQAGGPGGFDGGYGTDNYGGGFGPGGGSPGGGGGGFATAGGGMAYGVLDNQPLIGGSGSGGAQNYWGGQGGAGGGGALLIASSTTINISGTITAMGGGGGGYLPAGGSGGAIRLMARTIQGNGLVDAAGGGGGYLAPQGSDGRVRLEACTNTLVYLTDPPATIGSPGFVFLPTNPTIQVVSVAGVGIGWPPSGRLTSPDAYLPSTLTNPTAITVTASNVNVGSSFSVVIVPAYGTNMIGSNTLAGTYAYSTGVVSIAVYTDRVWRANAMIDYIPRP